MTKFLSALLLALALSGCAWVHSTTTTTTSTAPAPLTGRGLYVLSDMNPSSSTGQDFARMLTSRMNRQGFQPAGSASPDVILGFYSTVVFASRDTTAPTAQITPVSVARGSEQGQFREVRDYATHTLRLILMDARTGATLWDSRSSLVSLCDSPVLTGPDLVAAAFAAFPAAQNAVQREYDANDPDIQALRALFPGVRDWDCP